MSPAADRPAEADRPADAAPAADAAPLAGWLEKRSPAAHRFYQRRYFVLDARPAGGWALEWRRSPDGARLNVLRLAPPAYVVVTAASAPVACTVHGAYAAAGTVAAENVARVVEGGAEDLFVLRLPGSRDVEFRAASVDELLSWATALQAALGLNTG